MTKLQVSIIPVTPFQQNCSIIFDAETKHGAVVDPGGDVPLILQAIEELGVTIDKILLTHGHIDHAGGAAALRVALGRKIEGPHKADEFLLEKLPEFGQKFGMLDVTTVIPDRWLEEGDKVEVAGMEFDVYHAPGHSPGSVIFHSKKHDFALMGDVLFQNSIGRTDFPYGDQDMLLRSIRDKVLPLGDNTAFLPGHGAASQIGLEWLNNPYLRNLPKD